jgi:hypothetical protein
LTDLQRTATSAADAATKLDEQMATITAALKAHAGVPPAVSSSVANLVKQVSDLRTAIAGRPGQGGGGGGGAQPVRNRINALKSEVIGSQSLPTRVQSSQVDVVRELLTDLVGQMNTVITSSMPSLYKQLSESGIHPGLVIIAPIKPAP